MFPLYVLNLYLACVVRLSIRSSVVPSHDPHIVTDFHDNATQCPTTNRDKASDVNSIMADVQHVTTRSKT